jgi:16S rRNA (cytosine1402-N4)-methyltransferase
VADDPIHQPVLVREVVEWLRPGQGGLYVDCTLGLGGHTRALLAAGATRVIAIDRDESAIALARSALGELATQVDAVHADYRELPAVLDARGVERVQGIVADLGVSSMQLDAEGRGFSFRRDEALDMRMDQSRGATAAELVNRADEADLADVIFRYGEERYSRRIARALVAARPITTSGELAAIVRRAVPTRGWQRIWVNGELDRLGEFVRDAADRLEPGGRLAVVAFHSLEDRIVKHTMRGLADDAPGAFRVLTKKPVTAGDDELRGNPRARSAKLRVGEHPVAG